MKRDTVRRIVSLLIEGAIAVIVPIAWATMAFRWDDNGAFSGMGLYSLRYFTVLSNLLAGLASLLVFVRLIRNKPLTRWLTILRLVASTGVLLTFLTVVLFLGPVFGYAAMYRGANLWFHLLIPLLSAGGFPLLRGPRLSKADTLWSLAPIALYGVYYLGGILFGGVKGHDWYGFLNWGVGIGLVILAGLVGIIWGSGALLRLAYNRLQREA